MSAVYDLHDRLAERRVALDKWAVHVDLVAKAVIDDRSSGTS